MDFQAVLDRWIADASPQNLDEVRDAVQADPSYSSGVELGSLAGPLLHRGAYAQARDTVLDHMPGTFLSPMAHSLLSRAHLGLGNEPAAVRERRFARASLVSILNSGAGTETSPWVVLRLSDEYDVLGALDSELAEQRSATPSGRILDRMTTADGKIFWFELRNGGRRLEVAA